MDLIDIIRKHVLKNAFDYGKAQPGSIVGKVIGEYPDAKKDMKKTMAEISKECTRVNTLSKDKIEKEMQNYVYEEKKIEEKKLTIPNAMPGKVVVRFPPEPNGYPHIGHAKAALLSQAIVEEYGGKFILRWDDTNPEKESEEYVGAIKKDMQWLGLKFDEEIYASDWMPKLYDLQVQLFKQNDAYICTCDSEKISEMRMKQKPCPCRAHSTADNLKRWEEMLNGKAKAGTCVVLLKGQLESNNTAMRDPSLWRILEAEHYRQKNKYRVWPTYDFEGAVMDSLTGTTHALRSKEYDLRNETYMFLLDKLKLRKPELISISRLAIKGAPISKRALKPLVESGKLWGWDDPRLPTLAGLRRRGVLPQAIKNFVLQFGISKVESEPSWERLLVENRKLTEPTAPHYFAVINPVEVIVVGLPQEEKSGVKKVHGHDVKYENKFYISKLDADTIKTGETFRLKEHYNLKVIKKDHELLECEYAGFDLIPGSKKIQWVSAKTKEHTNCTIYALSELLNDAEEFNEKSLVINTAKCQNACTKLNNGDIIQFERIGLCKLDNKEKMQFILIG